MKKIKIIPVIICILFFNPTLSLAAVEDYLILQDIAPYKLHGVSLFKDDPFVAYRKSSHAGILGVTGHWVFDHSDITYETHYQSVELDLGVSVHITHHCPPATCIAPTETPNGLSWLLHELDREFRNYYGISGGSYIYRQIDGHSVMEIASGGRDYRWMSGNKVIMIEYHDSMLTKPEPIEVVQAYLAKHPSTLTPMGLAELRSDAKVTIWIKDEMDRRLWLCDKWIEQKQAGKVNIDQLLREMHDHMKVFLNYREKYYGIASSDEKNTIYGYMQSKDEVAMKNKLQEYKTWWAANKDKAINL